MNFHSLCDFVCGCHNDMIKLTVVGFGSFRVTHGKNYISINFFDIMISLWQRFEVITRLKLTKGSLGALSEKTKTKDYHFEA